MQTSHQSRDTDDCAAASLIAYEKPTLTLLGSFKELTRGSSGSIQDGGGSSMQMTM
jgi:hypothetical protein